MSASGGKADVHGTAQVFHKIDQIGTAALASEADIGLILAKGAANDPLRSVGEIKLFVELQAENKLFRDTRQCIFGQKNNK